MKFIVENCFHWVGYHLVDMLLENSHHVVGVSQLNTSKENHLAMFVSRNSLFTLKEEVKDDADVYIIVREKNDLTSIRVKFLNAYHDIELSDLVGEWMPQANVNEILKTKDTKDIKNMICVRDVISALIQWLESKATIPSTICIYPKGHILAEKKLDKNILLRNNRSMDRCIEKALKHYQTYKDLY